MQRREFVWREVWRKTVPEEGWRCKMTPRYRETASLIQLLVSEEHKKKV